MQKKDINKLKDIVLRLVEYEETDIKTFEMRGWTTKKWLDCLNQPYTEQ